MIREIDWDEARDRFQSAVPFRHVYVDDFFQPEIARALSSEFPAIDDSRLVNYANPLEVKTACNRWDMFPPTTYRAFWYFNSLEFSEYMRYTCGVRNLHFDIGLNGGGWHMHGRGGNNNVHLDYNLHPKLGLQRKLNIIVYLTEDWDPAWGGGLELWSDEWKATGPEVKDRVKTIENRFNRAVIFDTTQRSWHGLPKSIDCPQGVVRKSLAGYYVQPAPAETEKRSRALFTPREDQKGDSGIQALIRARADVAKSEGVYRTK